MIAEAFLTAALMLPPLAFAPVPAEPHHHASFAKFLRSEHNRILIVGGDPWLVLKFREAGLKTFGALIEDLRGVTPYHAVANPGYLPFQTATFQTVHYILENHVRGNSFTAELLDALALIERGGLFVFNEEDYPFWPDVLKSRNWIRVPFKWRAYSTWEHIGGGPKEGDGEQKYKRKPFIPQIDRTKFHRDIIENAA